MNKHSFTFVRTTANAVLALGLAAVLLFSAVSSAYADPGGVYVQSVSVGGPNGNLTYGTPGDVSYTITVLCAGKGSENTFTPAVTSVLPNGVTPSFMPVTLGWSNGCSGAPNPQTTTLTLHTTSATPGGVTYFSVDVGGVASNTGSLTVHGIQLAVTGFAAQNKQYDGTTNAVPSVGGAQLSTGVISPDVVTLNKSSVTAAFEDRYVGTNKLVTAGGFFLEGAQAANYTLVQPTTFASISRRDLHVYIDEVQSKAYDGTNAAIVTLTTDAVPGDFVVASGTGSFDNKNAGDNKLVTVPFVSLSGPDAGNYNAVTTTASAQANITKRPLTVTAQPDTKQYNGTTGSSVLPQITSGELQGSDSFGFNQTFDNENVGTGKTLTPGGAVGDGNYGNNYAVTWVSNSSGVITPRPLTVTALGVNRPYNGTAAATVALSDDRVYSDSLTTDYVAAVFTDGKNVGTSKAVSVTGISVGGTDAGNYSLSNTTATTTADISVRSITVAAMPNSKVYDGTLSASAVPTVASGTLAAGDAPSFTEVYLDKNAGSAKVLRPSGSVADGFGGNNYQIQWVDDLTGMIQQKPITSVVANNQSILSTDPLPLFTFNYLSSDFVSGDVAGDIDVAPVCGVAGSAPLPAGAYDITCSGGSDTNYDFTSTVFTPALLTVTGANNPPTAIFLNGEGNEAPIEFPEFQRAGANMAQLSDQDINGGDVATYSLIDNNPACNGADNAVFQIGGAAHDKLQINSTVADGYGLDYEKQPVLNICLQAMDSHDATLDQSFTIAVQNRAGVPLSLPSIAASDGYILGNSASAPGVGQLVNTSGALIVGDNAAGQQYRSILSFDTAKLLPDGAVLTKATLVMKLYKAEGDVSNLGNLVIDVKEPFFGTITKLEKLDFQAAASLPGMANLALSSGPWYSAELDPAVLTAAGTADQTMQVRLAFATASDSDGRADDLQFYSSNTGIAGNRPQLVVEYSLPSAVAVFYASAPLDGQVLESLALNGTGGGMSAGSATFLVGDNKTNQEIRGLLSFATQALPDNAIITGVQLKLTKATITTKSPFETLGSLLIDIKQPYFGTKEGLEILDFDAGADQSGVVSLADPSNLLITIDPSLLSGDTAKMSTQMRLHFAGEFPNNLANSIAFYSGNTGTRDLRPQLIITYSLP